MTNLELGTPRMLRWAQWFCSISLAAFASLSFASASAAPTGTVTYGYVLFHGVDDAQRIEAAVAEAPQLRSGDLQRAGSLDEAVLQPSVHVILDADYPAPSRDALQYFGRGVSPEQAERLEDMRATALVFMHPRQAAIGSLAHADDLALFVAGRLDALIWDDEVRLLYSRDAWSAGRIDGRNASLPSALRQTTIHAYRNGEHLRAVTLGMAKFGKPDLVVERLAWSNEGGIAKVIVAASQVLVEGATGGEGMLELNLRAIREEAVKEFALDDVAAGTRAKFRLRLVAPEPQEGDAMNDLLAIEFTNYAGKDEFARQFNALAEVYPTQREVLAVNHNAELELASQQAREAFESLRARFDAGLAPGEHLMVKAPFDTDSGGVEWMWVEVLAWEGGSITGLLQNEPVDVSGVDAGQQVAVRQEDIFDYLHQLPDGRTQGNATTEIILRMQAGRASGGE